ncbi:MAG TPA: EscU/YscU/HrcU family type III secretion system export apparatus switch protein [Thermotogota bacterium]|nr:EscU/YscU/HrcU family type III secretion system export apparatus switch protein [Thermotogota bacterium]HPJ87870.1 EscU/YscU/HrcU family type III secretion system export apparatus switch protein [Thermotogota bacterium]HPR94963.1 EscU/YscU/HrcU family type III secretion system export apparatus switch protein [Thermotogota bacterium]
MTRKTDQHGHKISEEEITRAAALKYDPEEGPVPRLVAQAKGELARRIVEIAIENDIPIYSDEKLVEKLLELDYYSEIPPELYKAVAEVIVYVYQLGGFKSK